MTIHEFGGGFSDGTLLGGTPVWTLGLPNDGVLKLIPPLPTDSDTRLPSLKIMWIVGPNQTDPVTLSGRDAAGDPLWFQVYPPNWDAMHPSTYTTRLALDPASPNRGFASNVSGAWSIWGIGVGAAVAGCYSLDVERDAVIWSERLAVGS